MRRTHGNVFGGEVVLDLPPRIDELIYRVRTTSCGHCLGICFSSCCCSTWFEYRWSLHFLRWDIFLGLSGLHLSDYFSWG